MCLTNSILKLYISLLHHINFSILDRLLITGYYAELTSYTSIGVTAGKGAEARNTNGSRNRIQVILNLQV